jgi:predicted ABC-type ATPase
MVKRPGFPAFLLYKSPSTLSSIKHYDTLRLRVFAGPNGSGKSTIVDSVREYKANGHPIDFGIYINADEIAVALRKGEFSFAPYQIQATKKEFELIVYDSGLLGDEFPEKKFLSAFSFQKNSVKLTDPKADERMAQILADFLRKKLLAEKKKFSFETVFSHDGKLDILRQAARAGYKVYLYFVSTESPEFNIERVGIRKSKGGHDVPTDKIVNRYYRSLDLLYEASQICYQAFFYDNTGPKPDLFAHFKIVKGVKKWDPIINEKIPGWFVKYYLDKVKAK